MKWPAPAKTISLLLALTLLAGAALLYHTFGTPHAPAPNPITTHVYVWQRNWSGSVVSAVRAHGPAFNRVVVLLRQISWENGQPHTFRVAVDWAALQATGTQVGAGVRVNPYSGAFDGPATVALTQAIGEMRAEAARNHVPLAEIQVDFDVQAGRLADYRRWVEAARAAASPVPLAITTVPSMLDASDFGALARAAGSYVLQVHGIEKPRTIHDPLVICDPAAARKAIAKAARLGVPFRVALPTYSYQVGFDAAGQYVGMVAEGAPADWGAGKTVRVVESHPDELAALVRELIAAPPPALEGIIWYRLPVESDKLNWRWPTLSAVMRGREP